MFQLCTFVAVLYIPGFEKLPEWEIRREVTKPGGQAGSPTQLGEPVIRSQSPTACARNRNVLFGDHLTRLLDRAATTQRVPLVIKSSNSSSSNNNSSNSSDSNGRIL
ncbi:hypothetical protein MCOR04_001817 [Pyricularia oryzae]|nr:hypothetical protein MCOR04_001817 [Pyricularia oryzae]